MCTRTVKHRHHVMFCLLLFLHGPLRGLCSMSGFNLILMSWILAVCSLIVTIQQHCCTSTFNIHVLYRINAISSRLLKSSLPVIHPSWSFCDFCPKLFSYLFFFFFCWKRLFVSMMTFHHIPSQERRTCINITSSVCQLCSCYVYETKILYHEDIIPWYTICSVWSIVKKVII